MKKLFYQVLVRDVNGKLYKDSKGLHVTSFLTIEDERDDTGVEKGCRNLFENYTAVCKEGSQIDIEVRYFNKLTENYALLYSFYGAENKFIKHN